MYKAHLSRSKQRKASAEFEIDLNFHKNSFISKAPLSLAQQVENKVTKSSSPINRRLQQEEQITFEKKKRNIFIKNLFVYKSLKNYIFVLSKLLFSCIKSLKKINTFSNSNTIVKEIVFVQKAQRL